MSVHIANGLSISNYIALTASAIWRANNTSQELNLSSFDFYDPPDIHRETLLNIPALRALFACLYILIFVVGLFGNVLVCYVVFRNSAMHTVTNFFITNLALSDILLCMFAVPFTPLYTFIQEWIFGNLLCKLVPYAQGVSVYISAFTLMAIAVDRFFVIVYPFKARLPLLWCLWLIILMWIAAALLTLPYGIFMELNEATDNRWYCDEAWPSETSRLVFGLSTSILQFVMPFIIITFCYVRVCARLRLRVRTLPGTKPAHPSYAFRLPYLQRSNRVPPG
ncbi:PRLHR [Cordylochernes scorpioides]|uniref:PRLHR n=1 Tax=Cordylochernes scorpioides TaxID=51811 RepID=A0ABY6L002_9ARAC|nr:PRLHR [Cordylochernes scorpioides]